MTDPQGVRYDAAHAAAYDRKIRKLMPGYEVLHETTAFLLAQCLPAGARVLVVGSGTGEELLRYAALDPTWQLVGVEPAAPMNEAAREKIVAAGLEARIELVEADLGSAALTGPFDAAVSLLVLHFLPDDGAKSAYLARLASLLPSGASCLLADLAACDDPAQQAVLFAAWRSQQLASRRPEAVALDFYHLANHVYPLAPVRAGVLLNEAGFDAGQPFFRSFMLEGRWLRRI
ncbi:SAM-dependent methyltransferase [Chitinimonas lacunae]|uniref:SAM-dependent methyltransferase n=1 Tax=Chitinimonas lacunae TaxID=1963018 RepID=A0ABV8MNS4_9NEIS